jgi:ferritin-like metal-binding protein YciE
MRGPKEKKCKRMEGLIEEGSEMMEEGYEDAVLDAALIGAAQRVEHYEIAAYGTVIAFAKELGEDEHASVLSKTLEEERKLIGKLNELAKEINVQADQRDAGEDKSERQRDKSKGKRAA